jgi:four helix bundle protein
MKNEIIKRMRENVIVEKSFQFAIMVVKLYQQLSTERKEYVISKQLLRCGTSIGANVEEAVGSISKKEFIAKMQIAYKEARETKYWIRLLLETGYLDKENTSILLITIEEILKILAAILKTSKNV